MVKVLVSCSSVLLVILCCTHGLLTATVPKDTLKNATSSTAPMTLKEVEKTIEKFTATLTKTLLPYFIRNSDLNLTGSCMSTFIKLFLDIRKLKLPAIKLLDSIAKPPYGMLGGAFAVMGEYDECLSVRANKKGYVAKSAKDEAFHGQYCTLEINLPEAIIDGLKKIGLGEKNISDFGKLSPFVEEFPATSFGDFFRFHAGICMPSTCTLGDLEEIVKVVLNFATITFVPVKVLKCEDNVNTFIAEDQVAVLCIFGIVGLLVLFGSVLEGFHFIGCSVPAGSKIANFVNFLQAFSIYNNTRKLLHRKKDTSCEIPCVNGMYVLGTFLVVVYHTYFLPFFVLFSRKISNFGYYMKDIEFTLIPTMGISIEAYFLFSGLFLVYGRFKRGGEHPQVNVIKLLIRRYFRLCPSLMLILGIIIVMPLIGSGPVWNDIVSTAAQNGRKWWYTYLGMYNNFLEVKDQTYLYLWFIPCLMQVTIIGAILAWILAKNHKFGIILIILTAAACSIALGIITALNNFPPSYAIYFFHNREHFEIPIYTGPLSHVSSFCVGLLLGYYMSQTKTLKWSKIQVCIGWLVSFLLTVGIQYFLYPYHDGKDVNIIFSSIYATTHKIAFSIGISWIILACSYGYGGIMGKVLSWKGFAPLSKLGYCSYLLHYLVIVLHVSQSRASISFSHIEIWIRIWSYCTLTFIAAYVFYIVFELPLNYIEAIFLPERKSNTNKPEESDAITGFRNTNIVTFGDSKTFKSNGHYNNVIAPMPVNIVFREEQSRL